MRSVSLYNNLVKETDTMALLDNIVRSITNTFRFKETIFCKENSDLQDRYDALQKLNNEYPNNEDLLSELFTIKQGLNGENEVAYQLKRANIGMYVLRDIKVQHEDLSAQIDYVIITPIFTYYVECKNLVGNITVNDKGDFIRELNIKGKRIKKGMYSPLRQVEAQRAVLRKIWEKNASSLEKILTSQCFEYYRRVLVVATNQETILNTSKAPKEMKYKILRADALVRQLEYDLRHKKSDDLFNTQKSMEQRAQAYLRFTSSETVDYYKFYQDKYDLCHTLSTEEFKNILLEFRKKRSNDLRVPAYYIFTNDELDRILEVKPTTMKELQQAHILSPIRVKRHGEIIIQCLNNATKSYHEK